MLAEPIRSPFGCAHQPQYSSERRCGGTRTCAILAAASSGKRLDQQTMAARGLIIAAPHSGAGKTIVTLSLLAGLKRRGIAVSAAKAGPDYIDPAFHAAVTGAPSVNLDSWAMPEKLIDTLAVQATHGADIFVLE